MKVNDLENTIHERAQQIVLHVMKMQEDPMLQKSLQDAGINFNRTKLLEYVTRLVGESAYMGMVEGFRICQQLHMESIDQVNAQFH